MKKILGLLVLGLGLVSRGWSAMAVADIKGTAPASPISGKVQFIDMPEGLKVSASLKNVPPGMHAFHIHEIGSCADMAKAAGNHYNPTGAPHGQVLKDGVEHAHAGDLGNITADQSGKATLDVVVPGVTLSSGAYTVAGRAVVLHEKVDDFSQPAGNAGSRIACGPIIRTK